MAAHGAKQQKKLAKKKADRDQKRKSLAQRYAPGMPQLAAWARQGEIVTTAVSADMFHEGLGYAWISRQLHDGRLIVANFLIDVWCLGVKNVLFKVGTPSEAALNYRRMGEELTWRTIRPADLLPEVRDD